MPLISFTDKGLYCSQGEFYLDPWKAVERAIISHAHGDHAKWGHKSYLAHPYTTAIMQARLGDNNYQSLKWNTQININGVNVSLHPAGHIIGSSQIRLEYKGDVWVFSGDYKTETDGISQQFEPVKCNTFITESTFGLPIYNWKPQTEIFNNIKEWIAINKANNKASVLFAYSLGKAQRILQTLAESTDIVYAHGAVYNMQQALKHAGFNFPEVERITPDTPKEKFKNAVILAPPSADGTSWLKKFQPYATGVCSGWMQVRGNARRRNADAGFVLSDHADWNGLISAVKATEAERVFVTHGYQSVFSRYLSETGIEAHEVKTEYGNDEETDVPQHLNDNKGDEIIII